ncbi:hypothetical protein NB709_003317 [Xanthomonas sacchari]|uniref:ABC-2 type transporter transmembrane domain-containing protein n=2 Tax=Xanthomonas TaxID=338 RepID=A0ABT3DVL0_9XANT|nr:MULTISPECIES: ABC transporter permease [Xanthomonas]KAA8920808.1 ABC transporter permease [Xanthomonas sontii]MCW0372355.1 hypothetical protein [Xanthomonas sacchari]MCW0378486.1 hypothetical protein [Xanthomonas sacchari]MCW0399545.1 hypothetical protein [Xanthomonas sacchari]MCW0413441.1 hypothetical protein [Xanthomonas sacchari]
MISQNQTGTAIHTAESRASKLSSSHYACYRDTQQSPMRSLAADVVAGMGAWRAWFSLAVLDTKHKYRRSILGPLWITISMFVLILGVGLLYSQLFRMNLRDYLPYIALGDIIWIYISTTVQEGCTTFTASENLIRSMRLPLTLHCMRLVVRTFIVFLHGAIAYIPFAIYLKIEPQAIWWLAIPGVVAILLASIPVTALFGLLSARFRDLQPAIANFMQLGFFMTPIIWKADMLGPHRWVADFNPVYHFIQLVRAPLMGEIPAAHSYWVVIGFTIGCYLVAVPFLAVNRHKISFWV